MWSNPRDIALIFLSLQALVMALIPLALIGGLAYGIHRLRPLVRHYLRVAFSYAELLRARVESVAQRAASPFIRVHSTLRMTETVLKQITTALTTAMAKK